MALVLWLSVCLAACVLWRGRPLELVIASLVVWTVVPSVASPLLTGVRGGALGFHAATWLVLCILVTQVVTDPQALARVFTRRVLFYLAIALVGAAAVLETKTGSSGHGLVLLSDEMLAPVASFWIISAALLRQPDGVHRLRNAIVALGALEAAWAVLQYLVGTPILFTSDYEKRYWYKPSLHRWMGTTDHPLVLSVLLVATIPLLTGLSRVWLQQTLFVLMLVAVVITQSRSGVIAAGVGGVFVVWASRATIGRKIAGTLVLTAAATAVAVSSLSTGVSDRIANDTGSALARGAAWDYFLSHWQDYVLSGGGINSSYTVADNAGLKTSFESAFLMYSIDVGIMFAAIYFLSQLVLLVVNLRRCVPGAFLAALMVMVLCQTFSSIEVSCLVGPLMWAITALATHSDVATRPPRSEHAHGRPTVRPLARAGSGAALPTRRR